MSHRIRYWARVIANLIQGYSWVDAQGEALCYIWPRPAIYFNGERMP